MFLSRICRGTSSNLESRAYGPSLGPGCDESSRGPGCDASPTRTPSKPPCPVPRRCSDKAPRPPPTERGQHRAKARASLKRKPQRQQENSINTQCEGYQTETSDHCDRQDERKRDRSRKRHASHENATRPRFRTPYLSSTLKTRYRISPNRRKTKHKTKIS